MIRARDLSPSVMDMLCEVAFKAQNAVVYQGQAEEDRDIRRDRQDRAVQKRVDQGWSERTARRWRELCEAFDETQSHIELGIDEHTSDRKGGRKRRGRPKGGSQIAAIVPPSRYR